MTYALVRLSLATRVPYHELVDMPPDLLATFVLAHSDLTTDSDLDDADDELT